MDKRQEFTFSGLITYCREWKFEEFWTKHVVLKGTYKSKTPVSWNQPRSVKDRRSP